jgi:lathosterol oxidase
MSDNKAWNYHPELPLRNPSFFRWPLSPGFLLRWLVTHWLTLSERVMLVLISVAAWLWLYPDFASATRLEFGWIVQTWLVNMGFVIAIAGSLHWYFYMRRGQGKTLKFDGRDLAKGNKLWDFSDQVHDNMFWTLGSGVGVLTGFLVLTMWFMANGWAPMISPAEQPVWFVISLMLLPIWSAFHFYWVHRLLHVPLLYRHVHSLHHRNVNIGPWSGFSMHPVEHLLYCSSLCVHWVVPSDPILVIFHVLYLGPGAAMTHTGYEDLLIRDKRRLALGTFYHQLHHRYYECNYGNQEMPWDRWFGTFHDGSETATEKTRARKKRMHK